MTHGLVPFSIGIRNGYGVIVAFNPAFECGDQQAFRGNQA